MFCDTDLLCNERRINYAKGETLTLKLTYPNRLVSTKFIEGLYHDG